MLEWFPQMMTLDTASIALPPAREGANHRRAARKGTAGAATRSHRRRDSDARCLAASGPPRAGLLPAALAAHRPRGQSPFSPLFPCPPPPPPPGQTRGGPRCLPVLMAICAAARLWSSRVSAVKFSAAPAAAALGRADFLDADAGLGSVACQGTKSTAATVGLGVIG